MQELAEAQHGAQQHDELEQERQVLRELHARRVQHLAAEKHPVRQRNEETGVATDADVVRTMAARRPDDGDVAAAEEEGGSTSGGLLLFRLAMTAAAVEQFRRRCTSLLCRGFTM